MSEIKIRLVPNWCSGDQLRELWNRMTPFNDYRWNKIKVLSSTDPSDEDYTVVINHAQENDVVQHHKAILFYMEPKSHLERSCPPEYDEYNSLSRQLCYIYGYTNGGRNNIEWHLSKNYSQLMGEKIEKSKLMSSITSGLQHDTGHKLRYKFLEYLDAQVPDVELYGRNQIALKSYKGSLPYYAKDNGLMPFKYTFAAENCRQESYFTEKLVDAILAECLCFYWGCPNISEYIDEKAYICIDLENPEQAIEQVKMAIANNEWEKRIDVIRQEKVKILNNLQFFPTLEWILNERQRKIELVNSQIDAWYIYNDKVNTWQDREFKRVGLNVSYFKGTYANFFNQVRDNGKWKLILSSDYVSLGNFVDNFEQVWQNVPGCDVIYLGYYHKKDAVFPQLELFAELSDKMQITGLYCYAVRNYGSELMKVGNMYVPRGKAVCCNTDGRECYVLGINNVVVDRGLVNLFMTNNEQDIFNLARRERLAGKHKRACDMLIGLLNRSAISASAKNVYYHDIYDEFGTVAYYAGNKEIGRYAFGKLIEYWKRGIPETVNGLKHTIGRIIGNAKFYDCPELVEQLQVIQNGRHEDEFRVVVKHKNLVVGFHENELCERGSTVALYDYAHYNEKILGNTSVIFYSKTNPHNNKAVEEKFHKRFKCYAYDNFKEVDGLIRQAGIDMMYIMKFGLVDFAITNVPGCKNLIHSVFANQPHGDKYAFVSGWMSNTYDKNIPYVPHMIDLPNCNENLRQQLNIPDSAIVLGRHGGKDTFDIPFVQHVIKRILEEDDEIYFLFVNTHEFLHHQRIIYLDTITDPLGKVIFINTCDAMLHARARGETFGLAVGEFSILNKPVLTYSVSYEKSHIELLGEKGNYYRNADELYRLLKDVRNIIRRTDNWNCYQEFTPEKVMHKFKQVFLTDYRIKISSQKHNSSHYAKLYQSNGNVAVVDSGDVYCTVVIDSPHADDTVDLSNCLLLKTGDKTGDKIYDEPNKLDFMGIRQISESADILEEVAEYIVQREKRIKFVNSKLDVYCINLARCTDRYSTCQKEFKRYGLDVKRFEATDGNATNITYEELLDKKIVSENLDGITRNQKGALALIETSVRLWKTVASNKSDKHVLIVEDDIRFHPDFLEIFTNYWHTVPGDADVTLLGFIYPCGDPHNDVRIFDVTSAVNSYVVKVNGQVYGNHAYIINSNSANKLLNEYLPLSRAVDYIPPSKFNMYAFKRPPGTSRDMVNNLYVCTDAHEKAYSVQLHGIASQRSEKTTIGHYHYYLLNNARSERYKKNYSEAYRYISELVKKYDEDKNNHVMYLYDVWDELANIAFYVDRKDDGRLAFNRLIELSENTYTAQQLRNSGDRVINNIKYYDCPDIYDRFKAMMDKIRTPEKKHKVKITSKDFDSKYYAEHYGDKLDDLDNLLEQDESYFVIIDLPNEKDEHIDGAILLRYEDDNRDILDYLVVKKIDRDDNIFNTICKILIDRKRQISFVNSVLDIYCINLEKSVNRWHKSQKLFKRYGLQVNRFEAVDGTTITYEELLSQNIVSDNLDHITRNQKGNLGLTASSVKLWRSIAERNTKKWTLILEDDVTFHPNFLELFETNWNTIPPDAELIYFGFSFGEETRNMYQNPPQHIYTPVSQHIVKLNRFVSGAFAYAINCKTANRLIKEHLPLSKAIDTFPPDKFVIYSFLRPPHTSNELVDKLYIEYAEDIYKVPLHGIIVCRSEKSTLGHFQLTCINNAKRERCNKNYDKAYEYLSESLKRYCSDNEMLYYFDIWDELGNVAYYVNQKELGRFAFKKLIEFAEKKVPLTISELQKHGYRILGNIKYYDCPEIYQRFEDILKDVCAKV